MNTLQHTLITLLGYSFNFDKTTLSITEKYMKKHTKENIKNLEEEISYVLLPDALRRYLGPRQYTHFEKSADGLDTSWLEFPENISNLSTKNSVEPLKKYLVSDIKPCVLGETTDIPVFFEHNIDLPSKQFYRNIKAFKTRLYV